MWLIAPADVTAHAPAGAAPKPCRAPKPRRDRGSLTVEFAVIAPALVILMLIVAAGGRVVEAVGQVNGAARDAARAASTARSSVEAQTMSDQAARSDLKGRCTNAPQTQVSGFAQNSPEVDVNVQCTINLSPFSIIGFTGLKLITGHAVAPLDTFTCRNGPC